MSPKSQLRDRKKYSAYDVKQKTQCFISCQKIEKKVQNKIILVILIRRIINKFENANSYRDLLLEVECDTVVETLLETLVLTEVDTLVEVDVDTLELTEVEVEVLVLALEYVE